jgi:hypothetical protein
MAPQLGIFPTGYIALPKDGKDPAGEEGVSTGSERSELELAALEEDCAAGETGGCQSGLIKAAELAACSCSGAKDALEVSVWSSSSAAACNVARGRVSEIDANRQEFDVYAGVKAQVCCV